MAAKKDTAGKDKEPQVRGKPGPPSSTPNEEGRKRGGRRDKGVPKVGKSEVGKGGGGLH